MIYIYGLIDPRTSQIRYIGKSIRPKERLMNHCNERSVTWRTNWLRELKSLGLRPILKIIEELPDGSEWQSRERYWIAEGRRLQWPLTNCTDGGDGVPGLPAETKERLRRVWIGRKHKPESLAKIGAASAMRRHDKAWRENMSQKMMGRKITWADKVGVGNEKLSADDRAEIWVLLADGVSQRSIARLFGVHQGTISNLKRGVSYAHGDAE